MSFKLTLRSSTFTTWKLEMVLVYGRLYEVRVVVEREREREVEFQLKRIWNLNVSDDNPLSIVELELARFKRKIWATK